MTGVAVKLLGDAHFPEVERPCDSNPRRRSDRVLPANTQVRPLRSSDERHGDEGIIRRVALVILSVLVVLSGLATFLYETRWPPRVDDRELARIGSPSEGARRIHGPYTVSGSPVCIDSCLVRGQWYAASGGAFRTVAGEVRQHLEDKGYVLQPGLHCFEDGPPVLAPSSYDLDCTISGRKGKFTATADLRLYRSEPIVATPTSSGEYPLTTPPPSSTTFSAGDGILVAVSY